MSARAKAPAGPLLSKDKLLAWVEDYADRVGLDAQRTLFLNKFAAFADAAMESWSKVDTMMRLARCTERMVQKMREEFVAEGVLEPTGRFHTLEDTRRKVPLYRWKLFLADVCGANASGAPCAPERDARVHETGPSGAQGVHLYIEPKEPISGEREARGRASEPVRVEGALIGEVEAAMPARLMAVSDRREYLEALAELAEDGVDLGLLPGCLRRWSVNPLFVGRKAPVPFETWLRSGQWRASLPEAEPAAAEAEADAPVPGMLPTGEIGPWMAAMAVAQTLVGPKPFASYLGPASLGQIGERLYLVALTGYARDWVRDRCWTAIAAEWARADAAGRDLHLVSKSEFEALLRQAEGQGL